MAAPTSTAIPHGVTTAVTCTVADTWYECAFADASALWNASASAAFRYAEGRTDSALGGVGHDIAAAGFIGDKRIPSSRKVYVSSATAGCIVQVTASDCRGGA